MGFSIDIDENDIYEIIWSRRIYFNRKEYDITIKDIMLTKEGKIRILLDIKKKAGWC